VAITSTQQQQFDEIYKKNPNSDYVKQLQKVYGYTPSTKDSSTTTKDSSTTTTTTKSTSKPSLSTYDQQLSKADQDAITAYKIAYAQAQAAGDKAGMTAANQAAEAIRAKYNYSGGTDGSGYNLLGTGQEPAPTNVEGLMDNTGLINQTYDAQQRAAEAALAATRDQVNSDYQSQIDAAPETFQPLRDQVDVSTARGIQGANEAAAAKGIAFSGGVQSDMGATQAAGMGQKTALNQQEVNVINELKRAISDNNRATSLQQIQMNAENTVNRTNALIGESNRMQDRAYQIGRDETADQQWSSNFDYMKQRDAATDEKWYLEFQLNKENAEQSRAIQREGITLDREKFEWAINPENPENIAAGMEWSDSQKRVFGVAGDMISQVGEDGYSLRYTDTQILEYIENSGLTDEEKLAIYNELPISKR